VPQVREVLGKGAFLTRPLDPDELFTRDELSGEQLLFGQTAAEFMRNEVLPHEHRLYAHDWVFTRELLKKAADLDLLRLARFQRPTVVSGWTRSARPTSSSTSR
jgi:hypothetical protein